MNTTILNFPNNSPIQKIQTKLTCSRQVQLFLKRDDLIHPQVSGNKWRKLKYNVLAAQAQKKDTLLTFGGAFSNHIYATAAAGKVFGFKTIGLIRGERVEPLNPTLAFAQQAGMQLHFVSRTTYRQKEQLGFQQKLMGQFGDFYSLPEGGTNVLALKGCAEIVDEVEEQLDFLPDYWCVACGTGSTISGIIRGLGNRQKVLGFSALKGDFLTKEVQKLLTLDSETSKVVYPNWQINTDYHFGGYAKFKPELIDFINDFKLNHQIQLDPVYTGKLFCGLFDLIKNDYFPKGSSILAVHTGGLQGIAGFNQRFGQLIT